VGAEDADREPAGISEELVQRGVAAHGNANERRLERKRNQRGDGQPDALSTELDSDDRHARRDTCHDRAQLVASNHAAII
jgi:hypothetical protein